MQIPKSLMSFNKKKKESIKEQLKRLHWFDSTKLKIVNNFGIEKVTEFDVEKKTFTEISYNFMPEVDKKSFKAES